MGLETLRPTATKPYTEALAREPMSQLATQADVEKIAGSLNTISQADSTAVDVAEIVADFNTLLANLRTSGVLAS